MIYPHLIFTQDPSNPDDNFNNRIYYVVIAHSDFSLHDGSWMDDKEFEIYFAPSIDIVEEKYKFQTEKEALDFIASWWKNQ